MERRFAIRYEEILAGAVVKPTLFDGMTERLREFVQPFADCLSGVERTYAQDYVAGLLSNLESKNVEAIAYFHDRDRRGLQRFAGEMPWDHKPLTRLLAEQVGHELGEADGVIVFDPSGFPKKGTASVGVQRQWCGRLGKVDNCQVGIYMGYVSRREHALVDFRLYLPKVWARSRKRCRKAGVPAAEMQYRTRHELILEMLADKGSLLPHAWITGDDELGRPAHFRQDLRDLGEHYVLAVPSNTLIRDLNSPAPEYSGSGRHPVRPWTRVDKWCAALPTTAWTRIDVRDGAKGPLVVDAVQTRVHARTDKRVGQEETLVILRSRNDDGSWKHDYYLAHAPASTTLAEFARVAKAEHRIEECLQRAKGEAGLADYELRTWVGWHHHQTLSLLATWFLVQEARRGKNTDTRADGSTGACGPIRSSPSRMEWRSYRAHDAHLPAPFAENRERQILSLEKA